MRKAASTGTLKRLAEGKSGEAASIGRYQPYLMRRSGSSGGLSTMPAGRQRKVASDHDPRSLGAPTPSCLQRTSVRTSAAAHFAPPPAMEVAEDVMEASFARGLASAECFELYGPVGRAPPLEGGAAGEEASAAAPLQRQLPPGAAQQMAACLATPFTGTDKNLGEILRSEVGRLNAEQELKTQLRYAEELRQRQGTEEEEREEQDALLQQKGGQRNRVRVRRRPSEELMEAQLLQEFGIAGGRPPQPPPPAAEQHSPETRVALQSLYASIDDDTNRLTLDEADISKDLQDEACMFDMDLGGQAPEKATSARTAGARPRALIHITATSAPPLF